MIHPHTLYSLPLAIQLKLIVILVVWRCNLPTTMMMMMIQKGMLKPHLLLQLHLLWPFYHRTKYFSLMNLTEISIHLPPQHVHDIWSGSSSVCGDITINPTNCPKRPFTGCNWDTWSVKFVP